VVLDVPGCAGVVEACGDWRVLFLAPVLLDGVRGHGLGALGSAAVRRGHSAGVVRRP